MGKKTIHAINTWHIFTYKGNYKVDTFNYNTKGSLGPQVIDNICSFNLLFNLYSSLFLMY